MQAAQVCRILEQLICSLHIHALLTRIYCAENCMHAKSMEHACIARDRALNKKCCHVIATAGLFNIVKLGLGTTKFVKPNGTTNS